MANARKSILDRMARRSRILALCLGILVAALVAAFDPCAGMIRFPPCPFLWLTGLPCPFCGLTRAVHHLLRFNATMAWYLNPLAFPVVAATAFLFGRAALEIATGFRARALPALRLSWLVAIVALLLLHWALHVGGALNTPKPELLAPDRPTTLAASVAQPPPRSLTPRSSVAAKHAPPHHEPMPSCALALALATATAAALGQTAPHLPIDSGASLPDPTAIVHDDWVYAFATGPGILIRRSKDLCRWDNGGRVFPKTVPGWAEKAIPGAAGVWAPDISCHDGLYHLYYSISTLGSQRSAIGLAVNRTLDPDSPLYAWEDRGPVIESFPKRMNFNAIDPSLVVEQDGHWWLFFGSWWTGIKAVRLDPKTGKPRPNADIIPIAARAPRAQPSIEAAYVIRREGHWCLFVSWGTILPPKEATYEVRVGRAKDIAGPYIDAEGKPMLEGGGTPLLTSHGPWRAPGHNGVLRFRDRDWMVHHTFDLRDLRAGRVLQVRPMYWIDGWPVVGEPIAAPVTDVAPPSPKPAAVAGRWLHSANFGEGREIELRPDGTIAPEKGRPTWQLDGDLLTLKWPAPGAPGGAWIDRVRVEPGSHAYVGRNQKNHVIRGIRHR